LIVLDTNVLSALMQQVPEARVVKWLDEQPDTSVWITSITLFEARFGLALLPKGKRRHALETAFDQLLSDDLEGRVLDFDQSAAEAAALLAAERQHAGRPVDIRDTQIAGIVLARHARFATRNIKHFSDLGARVLNPWEPDSSGPGVHRLAVII
jgi:predicted nucleic acid-binding protein